MTRSELMNARWNDDCYHSEKHDNWERQCFPWRKNPYGWYPGKYVTRPFYPRRR